MSGRPVWRMILCGVLVVLWAAAVPLMWHSVSTVPSAERLQAMSSRIMHVPSPTTFLRTAGQSLVELLVLVGLLWPWWRRFWPLRLLVAFIALAVWAVATVPLELTELEQVHHQWMVACDAVLLVGLVVTMIARAGATIRRSPHAQP